MSVIKNIQPVKVYTFPQDVYATKIMIGEVQVRLLDNGVTAHYFLLDDENRVVYDGGIIELSNDELSTWTNSDEQLIDIILNKLNLSRG